MKSNDNSYKYLCTDFDQATSHQAQEEDQDNSAHDNMAASLNVTLEIFTGENQPAKLWFKNFERLCQHKNITNANRANILPLYLTGKAQIWFDSLSDDSTDSFQTIKNAFLKRWDDTAANKWSLLNQYLSAAQNIGESAQDFVDRVTRLATQLDKTDVSDIFIRGFLPDIRRYILQKGATSVSDITEAAVQAESTMCGQSNLTLKSVQSQLKDIQQNISEATCPDPFGQTLFHASLSEFHSANPVTIDKVVSPLLPAVAVLISFVSHSSVKLVLYLCKVQPHMDLSCLCK